MAKLNNHDVLHVAKLAKLDLTKDEIEKFTSQLSSVITYFGELNEVDTEGIEPTSQTTGLENVTRLDEVRSGGSLSQEDTLSGASSIYNGYFKVKAILAKRTDK